MVSGKAIVIGLLLAGIVGYEVTKKAYASSYAVTLQVDPMTGNSQTVFDFSGTATVGGKPAPNMSIIGYYPNEPYTQEAFSTTTDGNGNFSVKQGGFPSGTTEVYAAVVTGYGAGGSSNPIIVAKSENVSVTISESNTLTATGGYYSIINEPDGSAYVGAYIQTISGGTQPYDIKFTWSDSQTFDLKDSQVQVRSFATGDTIATPTKFDVTSADGQTASGSFTQKT